MATKKKAPAAPRQRRAGVLTVTLTADERAALDELAAEHETSASRIVGAAVMHLRGTKRADRHVASAKDRAPMGRPRGSEE